jgi:hypothetical protein
LAKLTDQRSCPSIYILLLDYRSHMAHVGLALRRIHFNGAEDGVCDTLCVVGVDDDGLRQFPRRSGECTQDQRTVLIVAADEVFLRDQVHAVMQRGDQANVGGPVEALNLGMVVMPLAEEDWFPFA